MYFFLFETSKLKIIVVTHTHTHNFLKITKNCKNSIFITKTKFLWKHPFLFVVSNRNNKSYININVKKKKE